MELVCYIDKKAGVLALFWSVEICNHGMFWDFPLFLPLFIVEKTKNAPQMFCFYLYSKCSIAKLGFWEEMIINYLKER